MRSLFWAVMFLALAAAPAYADVNKLANPGFETGDISEWTSWIDGGSGTYNYGINDWGHDGSNHSVRAWSWGAEGTGGGAWQDFTITNPNQPLSVGGWIYQPDKDFLSGNVYAWLRVEFKNGLGEEVARWETPHLQAGDLFIDNWKEFSSVVIPSSLSVLYGNTIASGTFVWEVKADGSGSGSAVFDDMHVTAVPEPVASILFLVGGATLAVRKLRRK